MERLGITKGVEHVLHISRRKDTQKPLQVQEAHLITKADATEIKRWDTAFQQVDPGHK